MPVQNPEPALSEVPAVAAVVDAPPEPQTVSELPTVELVSVRAVVNDFYNPFTRFHFRQHELVENAPLDGWLQSQIDAGFIVRV